MPLSKEEKRERRADAKAARAADDAARGITRQPAHRPPAGMQWDEQAAEWVPICGGGSNGGGSSSMDVEAADIGPIADELHEWLAANPPPRLADCESRAEWDALREPWFVKLMGTLLPPYGDNAARSAAWKAALKRHQRGALSCEALEQLQLVRLAQRVRRQLADVHRFLWRAQNYLFNQMLRDRRYANMLELATLVESADKAVHELRGAPSNSERCEGAKERLKALQRLAWSEGVHEAQVRREVCECDITLMRFAAYAHWAAEHAPDGSVLWDEGVALAGKNTKAERNEAGNLALSWQALYAPQMICVDTPGIRSFELALDQEKVGTFSMAPPPALLHWLCDQPAATATVVRATAADGRYVGDGSVSDAESDAGEDDEAEDDETVEGSVRVAAFADLQQQVEASHGPAWCVLSEQQRAAARLLGFKRRTWDACPRHVHVAWADLIDDEVTAAIALDFMQATWDGQLQATVGVELSISTEGRQFADQLLNRAKANEATLRQVRAHPQPSGPREPNNVSQDREMQAWHEVRECNGALCRLPRACAWSWYRVTADEAEPKAVCLN